MDDYGKGERQPGREGLMANLALLWLGIGIILLPTSRMLLWQLDSSFGAKSLIGLLEAVFVLLALSNRKVRIHVPTLPRPVVLLAAFWFAWALVSVAMMEHRSAGLLRQCEWLMHGIFVLAVTAFFRTYPAWLEGVFRFVLISYILICALILAIWFNHPQPKSFGWRGGFAGFTHIRLFGHFTLIALLFSTAALWRPRMPAQAGGSVFFFVSACLAWAGLFWAGGRAPFLTVLLIIPIAVMTMRTRPSLKRLIAWFTLSAAIGALLSLPFSLPEQGMGLARIFGGGNAAAGIDQYSSGRLSAWLQFARHLLSMPWFGEGPDGYLYYVAGSVWPHSVQPHNFVLQSIFEWGIPGATAFLVVLGFVVLAACRNALGCDDDINGFRLAGLVCVFALLFLALLTGPLYHAWTLMLFSLALAISLVPDTRGPVKIRERGVAKTPLFVITSGAGLVFAANAAVLFVALSPDFPASPDDARVQMVRMFPAPLAHVWATATLEQWPGNWDMSLEDKCRWHDWVGSQAGWLPPDYQRDRQERLAGAGCR